jgi:hypothetical protein
MKIDPKLHSMQVDVPWSEYGKCEYSMPKEMRDWIFALGLNYQYGGTGSWGTGYYDDGRLNGESFYAVQNIQREDSIAFQLRFPKCRVHLFNQYEYN